jgi:hypothetical protein
MEPRGIRIIPFLQGKLTRRGKLRACERIPAQPPINRFGAIISV